MTEVPMPNYEEVIQRAGSLRAMTGLTHQELEFIPINLQMLMEKSES
jgi:hypothetical protein